MSRRCRPQTSLISESWYRGGPPRFILITDILATYAAVLRLRSRADEDEEFAGVWTSEEALLEGIRELTLFRAKDRTNAKRQRRYRAKARVPAVTPTVTERNGLTVGTPPERNSVMIAT